MKIGVLSDIHEDKIRLSEAFRLFERRQCDTVVCLGDITGFDVRYYRYLSTRDASYCLSMIRSHCSLVIAGNHDLFSIRRIPKNSGLFTFPDNWYAMDFNDRVKRGEGRVWLYEDHDLSPCLNAADSDYLRHLPEYAVFTYRDKRILFSHSIQPDLTGSAVWRPGETHDFQKHFEFLKQNECSMGISGHLHPAGGEIAATHTYRFQSFGEFPIHQFPVQIIVPCIAAGSGYNGVFILDLKTLTGDLIPIKSRRFYFRRFV